MLFSRQKVKDGRRRKKLLKGGGIYDGPVLSVIYLIVYAVLLLSFHHIAFEECRTKKISECSAKKYFRLAGGQKDDVTWARPRDSLHQLKQSNHSFDRLCCL